MTPQRVVVQGLGVIGRRIAEAALHEPALELAAAVDPALAGRSLAELVPAAPALDVRATLAEVASGSFAVLHATGSHLREVAPQLRAAIALGLHVVSTCEELAHPFCRHPELARELDALAAAAAVTVVGTGVNPGFVMDRLVATVASASWDVRAVRVERRVDPGARRRQFQEKVAFGLGRAEAERRLASGRFGHVGLRESGELCARALGWSIRAWEESIELVQPDSAAPVAGISQRLFGDTKDGRRLELEFAAHAGVDESCDRISVDGRPPVALRIDGGVAGEDATAAAVVSAARVLGNAPRGLVTVLDLPLR
jgi:4-hydroxy-tetrahydrodipicolinate reductase